MPEAARPVFISYARIDQSLVSRAVEFLRGGGLQVFLDSQSIAYGADWRQALIQAIEDSERVMLFWTASAAMSRWVKREWQLALKRGKKVVPTLLDDTPLPAPLARLHAVTSLRGLFPSPPRRPDEVVQALVQANDFGDDDELLDADDLAFAARTVDGRPTGAARRGASSRFRFVGIVGGLTVAGLTTWSILSSEILTPTSMPRVVLETPPVVVVPAPPAAVASSPASSASAPANAPNGRPTHPAPPPPAPEFEDDLIIGPWMALLIPVCLVFGGVLAWRRFGPGHRARAVVRELYAA